MLLGKGGLSNPVNLKYICPSSDETFQTLSASAVQSKQLPPQDPGVECAIVCFHFPWLEASCRLELCVAVGGFAERHWGWKLVAGRRPFARCPHRQGRAVLAPSY